MLSSSPLLFSFAVLVLILPAYLFYGFLLLILRQSRSPLRNLSGPKPSSWFLGSLRELHDAENNHLIERWVVEHGSSFVYKGFCGGFRLLTTDTRAIAHILTNASNYPKPSFVRAGLATMGGDQGLVVVEGEQHKRQRRILNQAFTPSQIRDVLPIFYSKAQQLSNIFLKLSSSQAPSCVPQAVEISPVQIDVLSWLSRATLDVIGLAGFGYAFHSLGEESNELATAFSAIFSAARNVRAMVILQVWFPWLKKFTESRSADMITAQQTTRKIGTQLVQAALSRVEEKDKLFEGIGLDAGLTSSPSTANSIGGKDLLSVLVRSNVADFESKNLSHEEILCQISTFMAAGHETTSNALSWILYQLAISKCVQRKLRSELLSVSVKEPSLDELNALPYLDQVVREGLRVHAPVTSTMRSAASDDVIPLSAPIRDQRNRVISEIRVTKGDVITIPIAHVNQLGSVWGPDAHEFRPERWTEIGAFKARTTSSIPGIYSNLLTFLGGPRSCIGYRFALAEIKVFLFTLLRSCQFDIDPSLEIEKKLNIVARPVVKSDPEGGNQMPLYIRPLSPNNRSFHIPSSPTSPSQIIETF